MVAGDEGEDILARLGSALSGLGDLERGLTRALHKTASPAELVTTLRALASVGPALGLQARLQVQSSRSGLKASYQGWTCRQTGAEPCGSKAPVGVVRCGALNTKCRCPPSIGCLELYKASSLRCLAPAWGCSCL